MAARRFNPAQIALLREELTRLARELAPTTVRSLYYQAVLSPVLDFITKDSSGSKSNYTAVQSRVLELRQEGLIGWDAVFDSSRTDYSFERWSAPADFASIAPLCYRLDLWRDQPTRPIVLVEKEGRSRSTGATLSASAWTSGPVRGTAAAVTSVCWPCPSGRTWRPASG